MNLRYAIGATLSGGFRLLLSRRWFPLFRMFLRQREWPYDIACHLGTRDVRTIFDVGANIGQTALYLRRFFPAAQIHCFELSKRTAEVLRRNTARFPAIHVHHLALSRAAGTAHIRLQPISELNSLGYAAAPGDTGPSVEQVTVTTIDEFVRHHRLAPIDILKIDAQAFDLAVLEGADPLLREHFVKFIYVEVSFQPTVEECQPFQPLHDHLAQRAILLSHFYEQWNRGPMHVFCNALYFDPVALSRSVPG